MLAVVVGSIAAVSAGLAYIRQRNRQRAPGLIYEEEEPGRMFEGFELSEGLAAERGSALPPARLDLGHQSLRIDSSHRQS